MVDLHKHEIEIRLHVVCSPTAAVSTLHSKILLVAFEFLFLLENSDVFKK